MSISSIKWLVHQRKVAYMSISYRLYYSECAHELLQLMPPFAIGNPHVRLSIITTWLILFLSILSAFCRLLSWVRARIGIIYLNLCFLVHTYLSNLFLMGLNRHLDEFVPSQNPYLQGQVVVKSK